VALNNTPLPAGNDYAYTARFIDLLGAAPETRKDVYGPLAGFSNIGIGSRIAHNTPGSYYQNRETAAGSKPFIVHDRIRSDFLTSCSQLLPSNMSLGITLKRSTDDFVLGRGVGDSGSYKLDIISASLIVKRVYLDEPSQSLAEADLACGGRLLYQRLQMRSLPCTKGGRVWNWYNCFNGALPQRVFVALVTQEAYIGDINRDSSFLESAGVSRIRFAVGGRDISPLPIKCRFQYDSRGLLDMRNSDGKQAFTALSVALGTLFSPRENRGVGYFDYMRGSTIFGVSLDQAECLIPVAGSLDVGIEFDADTTEDFVVLVMGEFCNTVAFDEDRNIVQA
jgi:hypothetical protein